MGSKQDHRIEQKTGRREKEDRIEQKIEQAEGGRRKTGDRKRQTQCVSRQR